MLRWYGQDELGPRRISVPACLACVCYGQQLLSPVDAPAVGESRRGWRPFRDELVEPVTLAPGMPAAADAPIQHDVSGSNGTRELRSCRASASVSARDTRRFWFLGPCGSRPASM